MQEISENYIIGVKYIPYRKIQMKSYILLKYVLILITWKLL